MKIENCPFYEGIDTCNITKCDKNILGMCAKKGSKNHPEIRHRTNFERFKLMGVDELANFIDDITRHCANDDCDNCPLESAFPCDVFALTEWLKSEVEEE